MYFPDHLCVDLYVFNEGIIIVDRKTKHTRGKKPQTLKQMKHRHSSFFGLISVHVSEAQKLEYSLF